MSKQEKIVTRQEHEKWESWTTFLQMSSLVGLVAMIVILESVGKETAKELVWWLAGGLFIYATVSFIVGHKSANKTKAYFEQSYKEMTERHDKMLAPFRKK